MEKDQLSTWNSATFLMDFGANELNSNPSADCFFNPHNWDTSMDQNDQFESALNSTVSSPTAITTPTPTTTGTEGFMIRELLGRLGSISNSGNGERSPQSCIGGNNTNTNSCNTSCYSTPLNSPPILNLSSLMESQLGKNSGYPPGIQLPVHFKADPGFVERAARLSCFGNMNYAQFGGMVNEPEMELRPMMPKSQSGKLSRVSSNVSANAGSQQNNQENKLNIGVSRPSSTKNMELGDSREGSSISEQNPCGEIRVKAGNESNSKKRKAVSSNSKISKGAPSSTPVKEDEAEKDEANAKRTKQEDDTANKANTDSGPDGKTTTKDAQKQNKDNSKPEPPKDYIHVRARRGQATDSHSLAERVRREKISERMKFLQDLVPGCNKVTGKAVVLDEIINYVQSLQRQVEFLSMRLAIINPRMEVNMDALLSDTTKEMSQSLPQSMYPLEMSMANLQNGIPNGTENFPFSVNHLSSSLQRNPNMQMPPPIHGFTTGAMNSQLPHLWEDDLQSFVHMRLPQNQPQNFQGTTPTTQMKVEL